MTISTYECRDNVIDDDEHPDKPSMICTATRARIVRFACVIVGLLGVSSAAPVIVKPATTASTVQDTTTESPAEAAPTEPKPLDVPLVQRVPGSTQVIEFIAVPGGDGIKPFAVSKTEITWDVYDIFVYRLDLEDRNSDADGITRPSKPYVAMDRGFGHAGYPAISMSAKNAQAFCEWLSTKTGRTYRLPTVAEWSSLCAANALTDERLDALAWHKGNAKRKTHEVGSRAPDALGLFDLFGNAREWCIGADGTPVTMGGSYRDDLDALRCDAIVPATPSWNASDPQFPKSQWWLADAGFVGVRLVCEIDP
ncbi:MAG: formylglycine-generating enzyme family protein [Planctomycetota bacterium]